MKESFCCISGIFFFRLTAVLSISFLPYRSNVKLTSRTSDKFLSCTPKYRRLVGNLITVERGVHLILSVSARAHVQYFHASECVAILVWEGDEGAQIREESQRDIKLTAGLQKYQVQFVSVSKCPTFHKRASTVYGHKTAREREGERVRARLKEAEGTEKQPWREVKWTELSLPSKTKRRFAVQTSGLSRLK